MVSDVVAVALFLLGALLLLTRTEWFADLIFFWRAPRLAIGETLSDGQPDPTHPDLIRSRWAELLGPIPEPAAHAGFLDVPPNLAGFLEEDKKPDSTPDLKLEVSGVQVEGLFATLRKLARLPVWQIDTHLLDMKTHLRARLELKRGSRSVRVWHVERSFENAPATRSDEQAVLDLALFEMMHAFETAQSDDRDLAAWKQRIGDRLSGKKPLPNGEALLAYRAGLLDFRRYYESGDPTKLTSAVESLRTLARLAPGHGDGLLLLGMVLIERRGEFEDEAIRALDRYIEPKQGAEPGKARRARLLRAIARMRKYDSRENEQAVTDLGTLSDELEAILKPESGASLPEGAQAAVQSFETRELLALTKVQLAHAMALRLAFLRWEPFEDVLRGEQRPTSKSEALKKIDEIVKGATDKSGKKLLGYEDHLAEAKRLREALDQTPMQSRPERSEERLERLAFEIHLTEGYALHRAAAWTEKDSEATEKFDLAISALEEAERLNRTHYLPLQYLGMVYKEPRFLALDRNKAGQRLQQSLAYLERATELNPFDFYGHEMLAHAHLRLAIERGLVPDSMKHVVAGIQSADESSRFRTWGTSVPLLRAQLYQLKFELSDDEERKKEVGQLQRHIAHSEHVRRRLHGASGTDPETEWARLLMDARRFGEVLGEDAGKKAEAFETARQEFVAKLDALIRRCEGLKEITWSDEVVHRLEHVRTEAKRLRSSADPGKDGKKAVTAANWKSLPLPPVPYP